jgi:hypothetical protein
MWSCARYDLHLSDDDFYSLTPRQFDSLLKRHRNKVIDTEFLFANLTSWVANTGFRSTEKPTEPKDFMPSEWRKQALKPSPSPNKPVRMTAKRRRALADRLNATLGMIATVVT